MADDVALAGIKGKLEISANGGKVVMTVTGTTDDGVTADITIEMEVFRALLVALALDNAIAAAGGQ